MLTTFPRYFESISLSQKILWCYLLWYLVTLGHHFDPTPAIWLNSLGITALIGFALLLSVRGLAGGTRDGWQTFRLFLMPFCVSSFSSLIKGKGFFLIFPPLLSELLISISTCLGFLLFVALLQRRANPKRVETTAPLGNGIGSVAG